MSAPADRDLHFSFFMFTADLRPDDLDYRALIVERVRRLVELGYAGFDVPIAPPENDDYASQLAGYAGLRQALDDAGLEHVPLTTNVGATQTFDPTSPDAAQRQAALAYLKSRVDITAVLRGGVMAGPIVFPYAVFPTGSGGEPIWAADLQAWIAARRDTARPVLNELGEYAAEQGVSLGIEAVDHWETPSPNLVSEVMDFLAGVPSRQVGVCIDSAHVMLGSDGPAAFAEAVRRAGEEGRVHSVHVSALDRGAMGDTWIAWRPFLEPVLAAFDGPLLIETFNAVPPFDTFLRLNRRKFWIPGEDPPDPSVPDAFTVAAEAIEAVRGELATIAHG